MAGGAADSAAGGAALGSPVATPMTTTEPTRCPSCRAPDAAFSKRQRKKPYEERRCKLCTAKMSQSPTKATSHSNNNSDTPRKLFQPESAHQCPALTGAPSSPTLADDIGSARKKRPRKKCAGRKLDTSDSTAGMLKTDYDGSADNDINSRGGSHSKVPNGGSIEKSSDLKAMQSDVHSIDVNAGRFRWSPVQSVNGDEDGVNDGNKDAHSGKNGKRKNQFTDNEAAIDLLDDTPAKVGGKSHANASTQINANDTTAASSASSNNGAIPRKKRSKAKGNHRDAIERARSDAMKGSGDGRLSSNNTSLNELKQKILGRSVPSMDDYLECTSASAVAGYGVLSSMSKHPPSLGEGTTAAAVAECLKQELTCPICHDRLYNPLSLSCGHSFCKGCLDWWLESGGGANTGNGSCGTCPSCREPIPRRRRGNTGNSTMEDDGSMEDDDGIPKFRVNTALAAVLDALYPSEMDQQRLAEQRQRRKAISGELGGMHDRGHEELVPLPNEEGSNELGHLLRLTNERSGDSRDQENGWISLYSVTAQRERGGFNSKYSGDASIMIRRNVVLDDCDQRYQLSIGLTKCSFTKSAGNENLNASMAAVGGILDIEICLLAMEEDEVDDSGFPAFVYEGEDDEALICTGADRIHTCIEASVRVLPTSALMRIGKGMPLPRFGASPVNGKKENESLQILEVPLSRGMIGRDGSVRFRIDLKKALDESFMLNQDLEARQNGGDRASTNYRVIKLKFRHADTGAILELRLPPGDGGGMDSDEEVEFCGRKKPPTAHSRNDGSQYLLNDDGSEGENDDEPNCYVEDGFLVNGSDESDEEVEIGSDEEERDEDDDDDGVCQICKSGGDLIVCDGGSPQRGGCGHAYHVECIGRSVIPPGDWICEVCAKKLGIDVGIEGHEFEQVEDAEEGTSETLVIDDSDDDDDDIVPVRKRAKKTKKKIWDDSDSE